MTDTYEHLPVLRCGRCDEARPHRPVTTLTDTGRYARCVTCSEVRSLPEVTP